MNKNKTPTATSLFTSAITKSMMDLSRMTSERTGGNLIVNKDLDNHFVAVQTTSDVKWFLRDYWEHADHSVAMEAKKEDDELMPEVFDGIIPSVEFNAILFV